MISELDMNELEIVSGGFSLAGFNITPELIAAINAHLAATNTPGSDLAGDLTASFNQEFATTSISINRNSNRRTGLVRITDNN